MVCTGLIYEKTLNKLTKKNNFHHFCHQNEKKKRKLWINVILFAQINLLMQYATLLKLNIKKNVFCRAVLYHLLIIRRNRWNWPHIEPWPFSQTEDFTNLTEDLFFNNETIQILIKKERIDKNSYWWYLFCATLNELSNWKLFIHLSHLIWKRLDMRFWLYTI